MYKKSDYVLDRILPAEKVDQLCHLCQQIAESVVAENKVFITEENLLPLGNIKEEKFSLLLSQQFSVLLWAKKLDNLLSYQVTLTFETEAIATLLKELVQSYPIIDNYIQSPEKLLINVHDNKIQTYFTFKLLEILETEQAPISVYPRFKNEALIEQVLDTQREKERILYQVTLQINQNQDLLLIVQMTIEQVQRLLDVDRLVVYQLDVETTDEISKEKKRVDMVTYEARASHDIPSILHFHDDICFTGIPECRGKYRQGFTLSIDDVDTNYQTTPCLRMLMQRLTIKSKLVAPIIVQGQLWGFLIAHQCRNSRQWQESNIKFVGLVAQYLAIAVYQAQSYQQLQQQKKTLEYQVNQRAEQLRGALLAAQVAHKSKSEFIDNMSHELLTPLTHMIGLSSTLLRCSDSQFSLPINKQKEYLEKIQDSGRHLKDLINEIIKFSQIEAGKTVLNIRPISLNYISRLVLQNLQIKVKQQKINLQFDWQVKSEDNSFWTDPELLQEILLHLLDNGIKFTPAGGTVILRVWREQNQAIFQIEDTGIGIHEEKISLIFQKFQQLESSRQRTYGGAGLGLALTKQLVELLGGIIEVESTPNQGSLFTVCLPNQTNYQSKFQGENYRFSFINYKIGGKIVLIEQDEELAGLICEMLTASDYQVIWLTHSNISCIKQIEVIEPAAIIIDKESPDVYEISQTLKELSTTKSIKIILLGNKMTEKDYDYLYRKVIDDYLVKPLQTGILLQKIKNVMANIS